MCFAREPNRGQQEHAVLVMRQQQQRHVEEVRSCADASGSSQTNNNACSLSGTLVNANSTSATAVEVDIQYSETISWSKVRTLIQTPTILLIYSQGVPGCIPWGMVYVYMNDYLSHNQHLTVLHATYCMTLFGIGSVIGQCVGGFIGQYLYNRGWKAGQCWFMGLSCISGVVPVMAVIYYSAYELTLTGYYILLFTAGLVVSLTGPNVRSILQVGDTGCTVYNIIRPLLYGLEYRM